MAMNNCIFNSTTVIDKLVNSYGLPAFLFINNKGKNSIQLTESRKTIKLIYISAYTNLKVPKSDEHYLLEDLWITKEELCASKIGWLCKYQNTIHAKNCVSKKILKLDACKFLEKNHLMGFAKAGSHYALIENKIIVAVASFSKGRKMNDLPEYKKSFELIRYASLPFISITGGLSKLINSFAIENHPGDIMTYIDPFIGNTKSYLGLGFILENKTKSFSTHIEKKTLKREFNSIKDSHIELTIPYSYKLKKRYV